MIKAADKINAVLEWQNNSMVHPLTCGNDSQNHRKLVPAIRDGEVILKCEDCDYIQKHIPQIVIDFYMTNPNHSTEK